MRLIVIFFTILIISFLSLAKINNFSFASQNKQIKQYTPVPEVVTIPDKRITINPSSKVKQGDTIFVKVESKMILVNPYVRFNGQKYNLFSHKKGGYYAMIGLSALSSPGIYSLILKDDSNFLNDKKSLKVLSANYPIQNLVISKSTGGIQPSPGELAKVQKAKDTLTKNAYWNTKSIPYLSPAKGCIISDYGLIRYYNGKPSGNYHKGVDIKAPKGETIKTIASGKVIIAKMFRLHGGTVAIDHGQGLVSFYLHMSKINIKEGQIVNQNEKIGEVGSTGFATGPHLHWGLYVHGTPVDPMKFWIKSTQKCG